MRFSKVLFVTPSYPGRFFGGYRPPVGIGYIEEFISSKGVATEAIDLNAGNKERDLFRKVERFQPQLIGVTMMTYQYMTTYNLINTLKKRYPEIKVIIGGPHVSALEGEVMNQCAGIDYAVAGEGELPMRDLCLGAPVESIQGMFYRAEGEVRTGGPKVYVDDLDQFPFPRFNSYPLKSYTNEVEISTSRGCPHKCIFCSVPDHMGRRIRYRSAKLVGEELQYFYDKGVRAFQFGDDNFLANRRRIMELLPHIESLNLKGSVLRCGQGIRADLMTEPILRAMKSAGFKQLGIGVESGSDKILNVICKHLTLQQVDRAVQMACEMDFDVTLLFVFGTPGETLEDVKQSIQLAHRHPVMKAYFFNLVPFPGTALNDWVNQNASLLGEFSDLFNRTDEWKLRAQPFFETKEMPAADRILAQKMTDRASRQIQVRTLRRKFSKWGPVGVVAAQAGRFNFLERMMIRNRALRTIMDKVVFERGNC